VDLFVGHVGGDAMRQVMRLRPSAEAFIPSNTLALSGDGHQLIFPHQTGAGKTVLYVVDLTTGAAHESVEIAPDKIVSEISWSPDQRWVTYTQCGLRGIGIRCALWLGDVQAGTRYQVTSGGDQVHWSTDSTWFMYRLGISYCFDVLRLAQIESNRCEPPTLAAAAAAGGSNTTFEYTIQWQGQLTTLLRIHNFVYERDFRLYDPGFIGSPDNTKLALAALTLRPSNSTAMPSPVIPVSGLPSGNYEVSNLDGRSMAWSPDSQYYAVVGFGWNGTVSLISAANPNERQVSSISVPGAIPRFQLYSLGDRGVALAWPERQMPLADSFITDSMVVPTETLVPAPS
jgi:WD40 repeat protein